MSYLPNIDFLHEYLNAYSPVSQEVEGQNIWSNYVSSFVHNITRDSYGTAVAQFNKPAKSSVPTVVIEAHCDEISWIITNIEDSGIIRVKRHGGSDNMIAPSKTVIIHTHYGKRIRGVFGWPAIHMRKEDVTKGYDYHELWVDTGLKDKEAVTEAGVEVGNLITFDTQLELMGDYYVGRSLDNKIGGYIIAEVARILRERNDIELNYNLLLVNSVQEEVGLFGARKIAKILNADLALVHDVCHNTNTPGVDKAKHGDVKGGEGPCLEYTSQNHRGINSYLREIAKDNDIPIQLTVGSYGNDTLSFFLENTPTAILASPLKYMHTTVEMVHKNDIDNCIALYCDFLISINDKTREKILKMTNQ